ncbi:MAG TPA: class I SAM-dependent methyltransferase [Pirellulales bacterium]|jgi:SAM-dependent methyltransferase|nr:class I SAM-dependent methyltransferase [Pirellulales bacterium]
MAANLLETSIQQGRFAGMIKILRFNWPQYMYGTATILTALMIATIAPLPKWLEWPLLTGASCVAFWLLTSLVVSHYVYDVSPLCRWDWIRRLFAESPQRWINIHMGLDDATPALRRMFPESSGRVLDAFDGREMTEPSIHRARRLATNAETAESVEFANLSAATAACDAVFLLFSAHEIRRRESQSLFFAELSRIVRPGGAVLLVEHLRDGWNFLAFGPGCWHFWPARRWTALAEAAGFAVERRDSITPFVAVFLVRRKP